ncbi:hypothetical protein IC582_020135 [Cucumis melo]
MINNIFPISFFLISLLFSESVSAQSTQPPGPSGPTNISAILEKGGQFSTFIKLLKSTQQSDQINNQLNNSNQGQGLTVFAPPDNAFSNLKPGTLNSLSDQQKVQLVQYHVVPTFISMSQFQTVSNPLRTQAGNSNAGQFPLNVTTSGSQVNLTTGVDDAVVANTIYTDGQLAVYQVDKVLLPVDLFGTVAAPAPAPSKPVKAVSGSDAPAGASKDTSSDDTGAAPAMNYRFTAAFGAVVGFVGFDECEIF